MQRNIPIYRHRKRWQNERLRFLLKKYNKKNNNNKETKKQQKTEGL